MNNDEKLIAPCGMNCAICSRYLAHIHNFKRSQCRGCRLENKKCSYLFAKCSGNTGHEEGTKNASFCYECNQYPCKEILRMDTRYRKNFQMSVIENLNNIKLHGVEAFVQKQQKKYSCPKCHNLISVHNKKCFICDNVTKLVEKSTMAIPDKKRC